MSEPTAVVQIDTQPVAAQEATTQAERVLAHVKTLAITNHEDRLAVSDMLKRIKVQINALEDKRKETKAPILQAGKNIDTLFNVPKNTYDAAYRHGASLCEQWDTEQERLRRIEEARLRALVEAENAKIAAAAAKKAEKLEQKGKVEEAAAVLQVAQAQQVTAPVVASAAPKIGGEHYRTDWYWRCKEPDCGRQDCAHLRKALPNEYLTPNIKELNAVVERRKGETEIPGVEVFWKKNLIQKTK